MIKKFFGLLALILLINFSAASAARLEPVTDSAKVLKATEVELLNQRIREIEQAHKIKIGVAFVKSVGGLDMVTASNDFLDENFANGKNGGIVLLVAMDKRKYEMSTDSRMLERITDTDGISFLKDKFQSDLSAGDYYGAAENFAEGVDELMTYYETNGVAYGQRKPGEFDPMAATMAGLLAILGGFGIRSMLIGAMSNVHHARAAGDYLKKNSVKFLESRDTFLFMNVQRRPRSSGGGRRGGGHGGGGHGGGGGSF
ncbi:MAG: TPM domain-containing protein [Selenomonadaceae bacterium]|nr:TPM domain-containing protein [Selenomonadaceae bacterium]MBQ3725550.1 TPM domain-containing protein [Selenomonadaceae bacterium]